MGRTSGIRLMLQSGDDGLVAAAARAVLDAPDPSVLVDLLMARSGAVFSGTSVLLASALQELALRYPGHIVAAALNHTDVIVREQATYVIGNVPMSWRDEALEATLWDGDPAVRGAAVHGLVQVGGARATAALLRALADTDAVVQLSAAEGLCTVGDPRGKAFLRVASESGDGLVREQAKVILDGLARSPTAPSPLEAAVSRAGHHPSGQALVGLLKHEDAVVRAWAADQLAGRRLRSAVPEIRPLLADSSAIAAASAAEALAILGDTESAERMLGVVLRVYAPAPRAGVWALTRLGRLGIGAALAALARDSSPVVRAGAVAAMPLVRGRAAALSAMEAMRDPDAEVRRQAALALPLLDSSQSSARILVDSLSDGSASVLRSVLRALGQIGARSAISEVRRLLTCSSDLLRAEAALCFGRIAKDDAYAELVALLESEAGGSPVRASILQAIAQTGVKDAGKYLLGLVGDDDPSVRRVAIEWLGRLDARQNTSLLLGLLEARDEATARAAAKAAGLGALNEAESALLRLVSTAKPRLAVDAALALTRIGVPLQVHCVGRALRSLGAYDRMVVAGGLGEAGDTRAVSVLVRLLLDEDGWVRDSAAASLAHLCGQDFAGSHALWQQWLAVCGPSDSIEE